MKPVFLLALAAVSSTGCAASKLQQVRETFSEAFGCPVEKVQAVRERHRFLASGCDQWATCERARGPCVSFLPYNVKVDRTRAGFTAQTGCPVDQFVVYERPMGMIADGCGQYVLCQIPGRPCAAVVRPTCWELAQERYDTCVKGVHDRADENQTHNWRGVVGTIAQAVRDHADEAESVEQCKAARDREVALCVDRAGPAR